MTRPLTKWPGTWSGDPPSVAEHVFEGVDLFWLARGFPFNRPILACSNVGVRRAGQWAHEAGPTPITPAFERFVRVELMADSFHGQDATAHGWFKDLEWLGPLVLEETQ